jgi:hypothetical protein
VPEIVAVTAFKALVAWMVWVYGWTSVAWLFTRALQRSGVIPSPSQSRRAASAPQ